MKYKITGKVNLESDHVLTNPTITITDVINYSADHVEVCVEYETTNSTLINSRFLGFDIEGQKTRQDCIDLVMSLPQHNKATLIT